MSKEGAHAKDTETGSIVLSLDGRTLLTRGGDDTVKSESNYLIRRYRNLPQIAWDIRAFKQPLYTVSGLTTLYPGMNAIFSPDEKHVVVGSATPPTGGKAAGGKLSILRREGLTLVEEVPMSSCVVKVVWHSKINQVSQQLRLPTVANGHLLDLHHPRRRFGAHPLLTTYVYQWRQAPQSATR